MVKLDDKRTIFSWAMYDWANSAFATTVMAGFFPLFFKAFWNSGVDPTTSTARLGLGNSAAGITVAILAPVLGAVADRGGAKKKLLVFFALMGVVMTSALSMISRGQWASALGIYVLASVGFCAANVFYDSLITAVASPKKADMVSALGYSLGYLGGAILFTMNVWMVQKPGAFGFTEKADAVRFSFLLVGLWWAVFSIPIILFVKEPPNPQALVGQGMIRAGLAQLAHTLRDVRASRGIFLFLVAYWLYIDGVDTIIVMAVDYGMSIGLGQDDLIKALLITNFIGFPAAIAFGWIGTRIGAKQGILLGIGVYILVAIWAALMRTATEFYVLAMAIGLVQGGVQALSRSYYSRLIPVSKSAEFFGFYNMLGKFAVILGPMLIGGVGLLARRLGASGDMASRLSITSVTVLFVGGAICLRRVKTGDAESSDVG